MSQINQNKQDKDDNNNVLDETNQHKDSNFGDNDQMINDDTESDTDMRDDLVCYDTDVEDNIGGEEEENEDVNDPNELCFDADQMLHLPAPRVPPPYVFTSQDLPLAPVQRVASTECLVGSDSPKVDNSL